MRRVSFRKEKFLVKGICLIKLQTVTLNLKRDVIAADGDMENKESYFDKEK